MAATATLAVQDRVAATQQVLSGLGKANASLHGEEAALRRAIGELIFFAGVNDVKRCQKLVHVWQLQVGHEKCCDYDRRGPLHIAAAEGAFSVCDWLISQGANINALDRYNRTPLEDAVRSDFAEIVRLLTSHGARVYESGKGLVSLEASRFMGLVNVRQQTMAEFGLEPEWEIDPADLTFGRKLGEGEFGTVHAGRLHGSHVAIKVLKRSDRVALGDFRTEISVMRKVHHPNAVQFLGAVTRHEPYMLVTELMSCSMAEAFCRLYMIPLRRQVEIALDFARGMAYLHARKPAIIHRDIKPANVMVGGNPYSDSDRLIYDTGIIKIADFGLSKTVPMRRKVESPSMMIAEGNNDPANTPSGPPEVSPVVPVMEDSQQQVEPASALSGPSSALAADVANETQPAANGLEEHAPMLSKDSFKLTGETGSYRYMAPEVFMHQPYNASVDVYSFSMIAYQLFEGVVPFSGLDPIEACRQAAIGGMRPGFRNLGKKPDELQQDLRNLLQEMWAPDPDDRPNFEQIIVILQKVLDRMPAHEVYPPMDATCCSIS